MTVPFGPIIAAAATRFEIDPFLIAAVCEHESSFDPWAVRYEQGFYSRYLASMMHLSDTERHGRAFSYGLMQVMGQVAREYGYKGLYLTTLCDPEVGVYYGCLKLSECLKGRPLKDALLRYNGGGDMLYPSRVLPLMDKYSNLV